MRRLREARGRTQLWVEAEADLGTGDLQRVESGRVAQPSRGAVERILAALDARYGESREVLECFGYLAAASLPSAAERYWAREHIQPILDDVRLPAYALECAARLVAWNGYFPRLLGPRPESPRPESMTERSLLFSWFDPGSRLGATVSAPEAL